MPTAPAKRTFQLQVGTTYRRLCDASAAVFLNSNTFAAASDEAQKPDGQNRLQIYRVGIPDPVGHLDLNAHLKLTGDRDDANTIEADIESAARIGDMVYWITSHGRDSEGGARPNRQRFFATQIQASGLKPLGTASTALLSEVVQQNPALKSADQAGLPPEAGGISIEGLCQGAGNTLWVGFRSPLTASRALCGEITNPPEVIRGKKPVMGPFWTLDLGGRGIRDWTKWGNRWLILAGSAEDKDDFALYEWKGKTSQPTLLGDVSKALEAIQLDKFHPEALVVAANNDIWLFSDDGSLKGPGGKNKNRPEAERSFRSVRVILGQASTR